MLVMKDHTRAGAEAHHTQPPSGCLTLCARAPWQRLGSAPLSTLHFAVGLLHHIH